MKRSTMRWIASSAAIVLIAVGSANASADEPGDKLVAGSKALSHVGDDDGGVATVSYVGDLPCGGCNGSCGAGSCGGGSCDSGSCDTGSCDGGSCDGGSCDGGSCDGGSCDGGSCDGGCSSCGGGACKKHGGLFGGGCKGGDCGGDCGYGRSYGRPDLFFNYFTQGNANRTNAQMYLSPLPVPPNVGHTYFTYQPFYPHEMLYWHKDKFHNYYDGGRGMNRTRASYYSPPIRQALSNIYWNKIRLPR